MKHLDVIIYFAGALIYASLLFGGVTYGFMQMASKGVN